MRCLAIGLLVSASLGAALPVLAAPKPEIGAWGIDLAGMSRTVRPGDDFYEYVNETWLRTAKIAPDLPVNDEFVRLYLSNEKRVGEIIQSLLATPQSLGSDGQRIADFYRSALDQRRLDALGLDPIRADLAATAAIRTRAEAVRMLAMPWQKSPIDAGVLNDAGDPTRVIATVGQGGLTLPSADYYLKPGEPYESLRRALRTYVAATLTRARIADADARAERIVALETEIARRHWSPQQQRDPVRMYHPMSVEELARFAPGFDWPTYLEARGFAGQARINVITDSAVQAIAALFAETPIESWKDYLTFHQLDTWSDNLSEEWQVASFEFHQKTLQGVTARRRPEARATQATNGFLGEPIGRIYVTRWFPPAHRAQVDEMVRFIRAAFERRIRRLAWMDEATRAEALAKLTKVTSRIGYPDRWRDFSSVTIKPDDYVGNVKRYLLWRRDDDKARLGEPTRTWEWPYSPQEINAGYMASTNSITFPAGILQAPFFDPAADPAVNFGSIAAVIGHEFGHGFDDQGSRSDGDGRLRDWWTAASRAEFEKRTSGLVAQFDQYEPVPGARINGRQNLGENIGDLGGLSIAYEAYRQYVAEKQGGRAPMIDGFSGDQRFFLAWAQLWRARVAPEEERRRTLTDPHSAGRFRANGIVRNMDAWYDAFGVKPGDKLYLPPEQRVRIW